MPQSNRPFLAEPRKPQIVNASRNAVGSFDVDAYHVMERRDSELIEQEILYGTGSNKFVYNFSIRGSSDPVSGISVVGARHLAAHYGGIRHRLVASTQKTGELFTFTSYPAHGMPMQVSCAVIPELREEPDFFGAVCEIQDIKTGNSVQIERRENRFEARRDGSQYERPNYATIAQSKAFRNGVLSLIPQDIQLRWKAEMLKLNKNEVITESVIDEKRRTVMHFASQKAIPLDRRSVEALTLDQIAGLGDAAREGALPAFVNAAKALGLDMREQISPETGEVSEQTITDKQEERETVDAGPQQQQQQAPQQQQRQEPPATEQRPAAAAPKGKVQFEM